MVGLSRRTVLAALPVALAAGRPAFAATQASTAGVDQPGAISRAAMVPPPPTGALEDRMAASIDSSGFGARAARNELFVLQGTAPVQVQTGNPDWLRYRQVAYENALLEAEASFVADRNTRILTKTMVNFYKAANDAPPPYADPKTPGQAADVIRKLLAVGGKVLDKRLQDLGIDPKQYETTPEPQRTPLLTNHLKTTTLEQSFGDSIGMCPVMTFEELRNGADRIGVVAVTSAEMRDFAQQVLTMRGEFPPNTARAQDLNKLTVNIAPLVEEFGVRRLFDSQGLPVVVSFAQWATAYRGTDPALAATYRDSAEQQASMLADAQIADFLKGSVDYSRTSSVGQAIDRIAVSMPDTASIDETKQLIDEMRHTIIRSATINITGLRTLRVWTGHHPAAPDQTIIGVVRIWSAAGERAMRAEQRPKPATTPAGGAASGASGELQGRKLMDANDF